MMEELIQVSGKTINWLNENNKIMIKNDFDKITSKFSLLTGNFDTLKKH